MASSSSSSVQRKHQVFLSFRGEDTRNNFTSHLLEALEQKGIDTFVDYQLERGEEISEALLTAIEESTVAVVVLSKNYASSTWCLDELSKIIECKKRYEQTVVPIFYHVDPSDVRKQTGSFAEAFAKHQQRFKDRTDKVLRWRTALEEVGNLSGWYLPGRLNDRPESILVAQIVDEISKKLMCISSYDTRGLIGIDSRIERIESLLSFGLEDVRTVGIWGMGGIGKTTLSEAVFNRFVDKFDSSCFLPNVKENYGRGHLQKDLFSKLLGDRNPITGTSSLRACIKDRLRRKRVLIVLDDVDTPMQLDLLLEKHFFGPGSRIIVTSRDKQLLRPVVDVIYKVEGLNNNEALHLFSLHAFKLSHPKEDFIELSEEVVHYAQGIPLALKVLGSYFYERSKLFWEGELKKLKEIPNPTIDNILRISFDGLDGESKNIFLDIACFLKGMDRDYAADILDGSYISSMSGISVLIDKSLATILDNKLEMHDLVQQMARNIVIQESNEPGKRSRLWSPKDISHVLEDNMGTESVEGIFLDMSKIKAVQLSSTTFKRMCNLKFLKFYFSGCKRESKVHLPEQGLEYLPNKLRYLHWDCFPSQSLPSTFLPENLVELSMINSCVRRLWNGVQNLVELKRLNLSRSQHLIEIPDLSQAPNLERIDLDGCRSLVEVPASIQYLNKLSFLSLAGCQNLRNFPSNVNLRSLKTLNLNGCLNVTKFPEISENLERLNLSWTAIEEVPSSSECLSTLVDLDLSYCRRLQRLPSNICKLKFLKSLNLSGCSKLESFPEILETMECLEYIPLSDTLIEELPSSIENLVGLITLEMDCCVNLKNLPSNIWKLKSLKNLSVSNCLNITKFQDIPGHLRWLNLSGSNFETIPAGIKLLELELLDLSCCKELQFLPELPPRLQYLDAHDCTSLEAVAGAFPVSHHRDGQRFIFTNCINLDHKAIWVKTQLSIQQRAIEDVKYHKESYLKSSLSICIPGSEIPRWFSCQNLGSTVTTQLPPHSHGPKFAGYAVSAVVAFENGVLSFMLKCRCNFITNDLNLFCFTWKQLQRPRFIDSDHVLLGYNVNLYDGWYSGDSGESKYHPNEASFEFFVCDLEGNDLGASCKVKKCGVCLLYSLPPRNGGGGGERRLDHDLSRFEMIYPSNGGGGGSGVNDEDLKISMFEEENMSLKERLFFMERELQDLRRRVQCLENLDDGDSDADVCLEKSVGDGD